MNSSFVRFAVAATIALTACSSATDPGGGTRPAVLTALPRALTASELKVIGSANDFSFSLFRTINAAQAGANVFTSPLSASMALGMTMNGAANTTYDQMRAALAFGGTTDADINQGYKSLIALLRGLDASVDFRIANSIWYRTGFPVTQTFLDAGTSYFDAQVSALDFSSQSAVGTINAWVNTATASKIPTIIDKIDPSQVMLLINAIYFKGSWRDKFDATQTADAPFHGVSGDRTVKLMHRNGTVGYLGTADFDAADLPYGNAAFSMTVILPKAGKNVETIAASMKGTDWSTWTNQFHDALVDLYLPRFTFSWDRTLNDDLKALGMRDAFQAGAADFTRMSSLGRQLIIDAVKQKTYVDVNEEGTEAAAVTSVGVSVTSAPVSVQMRVDRPFIFLIRERLTGTVLFMGKMVTLP